MILVDRDIKNRSHQIFTEGYDEKNVTPISYDLHVGKIILSNDNTKEENELDNYILWPGEYAFIKTLEAVKIPYDLVGLIGEKNSRFRQGLVVEGPHYFPGHETYMFLRAHNISDDRISIASGDAIAQIFFEQLAGVPDITYGKQAGASFNNETTFRGLGGYKNEYK